MLYASRWLRHVVNNIGSIIIIDSKEALNAFAALFRLEIKFINVFCVVD